MIEPLNKTTSRAGHVETYYFGDVTVSVPAGTPIDFAAPVRLRPEVARGLAALRAVA